MESEFDVKEIPGSKVLTLKNICLQTRFNEVLQDINITLCSGEIHALTGNKGSGKSSLGKIICGIIKPNSGQILHYGTEQDRYQKNNKKLVIKMLHQSRTANPHFTVWEHLFFDSRTAYNGVLLSKNKLKEKAADIMEKAGFELDVNLKIEQLNDFDYFILELIRITLTDPDIIIIDENFFQLPHPHIEIFSKIISKHKLSGCSILLITHNIELLYDFADKITIIKNGRNLFEGSTNSIDKINLIRLTYADSTRNNNREDFYRFLRFNKAILEDLPVKLIVLDENNTIILANEYFEKFLGLQPVDYYNKHVSSFFEWQNDRLMKALDDSQKKRELRQLYNVPIAIKGKQTINTLKILPIHDGVTSLGKIVLIEDVTDYFNFQKKMVLSGNLESLGILAAGVAHEINNSLEIAFNYLRFLNQQITRNEQLEPINELRQELFTIKQIVSKLVNFSDANAPKAKCTDLNLLIEGFVKIIEKHNEYENIFVQWYPSREPALSIINPNEFREVLTNLIKNSRDTFEDGGVIKISTCVRSSPNGDKVIISVEDDGPGIPSEMMEKVFLPFFSTKKRDSENVGMGLSLCYSIIDRCGGTIYAENVSPKGCRFTIELPAEKISC